MMLGQSTQLSNKSELWKAVTQPSLTINHNIAIRFILFKVCPFVPPFVLMCHLYILLIFKAIKFVFFYLVVVSSV